jgi:hypothetical protein
VCREKCVSSPKKVAFAASESCKAPTRPPSAKVWVPAIVGDDVIADFALALHFGRLNTAVAGQRNQLGHVTPTLLHARCTTCAVIMLKLCTAQAPAPAIALSISLYTVTGSNRRIQKHSGR